MFNKSTVFVIGAGASAELDMPLGIELIRRVANAVTISREPTDLIIAIRHEFPSNKAERLIKCGSRLSSMSDRFESMDEVLHFWRKTLKL